MTVTFIFEQPDVNAIAITTWAIMWICIYAMHIRIISRAWLHRSYKIPILL